MIPLKNILVATDFSDAAAWVLGYGWSLAAQFGATLHVIYVANSFFALVGGEAYLNDTASLLRDAEHAAQARLDEIVASEDRQKLHARTTVLTSSSPASSILRYAANADIDLIVIGNHGHGGIAHLLMGGVAEKVVKRAPCPVLIVKPGEHGFPTGRPPERAASRKSPAR